MVWYGMVWLWYGMVWYGMVWYGMYNIHTNLINQAILAIFHGLNPMNSHFYCVFNHHEITFF